MKFDLNSIMYNIKKFVSDTYKDFTMVWSIYPNVLVWSGVIGIILFLI